MNNRNDIFILVITVVTILLIGINYCNSIRKATEEYEHALLVQQDSSVNLPAVALIISQVAFMYQDSSSQSNNLDTCLNYASLLLLYDNYSNAVVFSPNVACDTLQVLEYEPTTGVVHCVAETGTNIWFIGLR